ncbi:MAG: S8 family serine peptidase, partial [Campylobacterota bacterium]|nr:S8 family serine peptidase [Campylobacterota bacterium]
IIDDGFNLKHEDLKGLHVSFEYDATSKNMSTEPKYSIDFHGTLVAGVIFGRRNSFGVDGIAPQAKLIAIRQTTNLTSDVILAFTVASLASADIINCSWNSPMLLEPIYDTIVNIAKNGRDGKGVAVVFSAGNSSSFLEVNSSESAIEEVITVGASQKYSNYGDVVDIILKSGIKSTYKNGYENFSGTSATASMVSGLLALEMEQNRSLHVSDLLENLKKRLKSNE